MKKEPNESYQAHTGGTNRATLRHQFIRYVWRVLGRPYSGRAMVIALFLAPLTAPSFADFWRRWNPFVGFWIVRYGYRPFRRVLPRAAAVLAMFALSGFLVHDLATTLIKCRLALLSTTWFVLMGATVILGDVCRVRFGILPPVLQR